MANVAHSTLTGADLHENKGAAAATDDFVATVTTGATVWKKLTASNLTGTGNSFGAQLLHVRDEKAANTSGGTYTGGFWSTRDLNTTKTNEISSATLTANQISLPSGTYYIEASAPGFSLDAHVTKLYNVTDASDILVGTAETASSSDNTQTRTWVKGRFTLSGTKTVSILHRGSNTVATVGLGKPANLGVVEVYAEVLIWKIS